MDTCNPPIDTLLRVTIVEIKILDKEKRGMSEERYTPTKLEWLVVNMQAWAPMLLSQMRRLHPTESIDDVRVFFKTKEPDTVQVVVRHVKAVPKSVIDYLGQEIGREVGEFTDGRGWDSQIKLEWDVRG
jgi:hypothetical protein